MSTTLDTAAKVQKIYGGTWERWGAGKVPVGVDPNDTDFNAPNKSGGSKTVTLTVKQMPSHTHKTLLTSPNNGATGGSSWFVDAGTRGSSGSIEWESKPTGGGQAHNNLQPYMTLYMWRRTA